MDIKNDRGFIVIVRLGEGRAMLVWNMEKYFSEDSKRFLHSST